ncbi:MAG: ATP-binding protein, partial [Sphaerochaeta sp.]
LANMTPHTLEDALSWEDEYTQAEEHLRQIDTEQEETHRNLDACKISDEVRMDLNLPGLINQRIEALKTAEQELNAALKDAGQAKAARKTWEDAHQWIVTEKPDETTLKSMVLTLRDLSYRSEPLRCMLASRAQVVQSLGEMEEVDEEVLEQLREVRQSLTSLLSLACRRAAVEATIQMKSSTVVFLSLIIGTFFSLLGYLLHPDLGLLAIPSLLMVFLLARRKRVNPEVIGLDEALGKASVQVNKLLERTGQPALEVLDSESIARRIGSLSRSIATMERAKRENEKRYEAKDAYDQAYQAYVDFSDAWNTATSDLHLGDDPALEGAQFFHFAEHLQQWVLSCAREAEAEATLDDAKLSYAKAFEALQKICEATTEDLVELKNEAAILVSSITDARRYYEQLIKERDACKRAKKKFEEISESRQTFYSRFDLALGDVHTLKRLAPQVAEYSALATQVQIDKASLERYSAIVIQEASSHERSSLQTKLEAIKANLENLDNEKKKLWDMEKTYEDLCSDTELEEAELNLEKAAELLDTLRHEEVSKRMVHLLYEQVKEQSERIYQPQVLSRASQWFKRITKNRYTLSVGDDGFLAQDTVMMRSYSLDELSSGSRIQLLFSLRMAFIELLESNEHYRFPLFFDELMANSDDERSLAIAEAIAEISRERQVFYCTAQADEVGKLQQVVGEQVLIVNLIDRKRNYQESIHPFEPVAVEREELPQFCEDYNVYAQHCKVAKPLLWEPLGILSPWYLCTSSGELEALLKRGFSTCGQAKEVSDLYQRRLSLLSSAQKLARKGRPRIVTKADLEDDELKVNRNAGYYASLLTFLEDGDKTGNDVLEAIQNKELKAIRETTREVLSSFLVSRGFASDEYPLFPDEILSRISLQDETLLTDSDEYLIVKRYLAFVLEGV